MYCNTPAKSFRIQHTQHSYLYIQSWITNTVDLIPLNLGNVSYLLINWLPSDQMLHEVTIWSFY
jgi:hypothetical protein